MKTCECDHLLADNADRCPHCGARFAAAVNWGGILTLVILLVGITVFYTWMVQQ